MPSTTNVSKVAQCWPSDGTHCRSSAQIAHTCGVASCSTPQVRQSQNSDAGTVRP